MYRKTAVLAAAGLSLLLLASRPAAAQQPSDRDRSGESFGQRLDRFNQNVFGGLFPKKKQDTAPSTRSAPKQGASNNYNAPTGRTTAPPYNGGQGTANRNFANNAPLGTPTANGSADAGSTYPGATSSTNGPLRAYGGTPMRVTRPSAEIAARPSVETESDSLASGGYSLPEPVGRGDIRPDSPVMATPGRSEGRSEYLPSMSAPSIDASGESNRLHDRLLDVRRTASDSRTAAPSAADAEPGEASLSSDQPTPRAYQATPTRQTNPTYSAAQYDPPDAITPIGATPTYQAAPPTRAVPAMPPSTDAPLERVLRNPPDETPGGLGGMSAPSQAPVRDPILPGLPGAALPDVNANAYTSQPAAPATSEPADRVLFTRQGPILNVRTVGPRRISVGKESTYEVYVENLGKAGADNVVVMIGLPDWADVLGAEATAGATLTDRSPAGAKQFRWKVGSLAAQGQEKIVLRIVPRQSRPIDLSVNWDFTPVASKTVIEVQEPKLSMNLDGPREVFFGKKETFRLEIANSGNGDADSVVLTLMPLVPGEGVPGNHDLGPLAAGKKKVIEIELTARQKGTLTVRVDLRCDGEIRARLNEKLLVRKPDLQLSAEGPKVQFMGTVATYQFVVANPGNAPAKDVVVTAKLPPEAKYLSSDTGGSLDVERNQAVWKLKQLGQGERQTLQIQCQLVQDGFSRIEAEAVGEAGLNSTAAAVTKVDAMADLALEVSDPPGPVPVGQEATYQIRIHNRGTKTASGIEVVAYFSRGIEPVSVQGGPYNIGPGQVVFDAIGALPAGKEIVLKIKARADAVGNHMFRTEVYCKPLGTRLVGEETTHFYQGGLNPTSTPTMNAGVPSPMASTTPPGVSAPPLGAPPTLSPLRTADQRNESTALPALPGPPTLSPLRSDSSTPISPLR